MELHTSVQSTMDLHCLISLGGLTLQAETLLAISSRFDDVYGSYWGVFRMWKAMEFESESFLDL